MELSKSDVVSFCRDKLSKFKIPRQIEMVDELPKSAMGKILRRVLRAQETKDIS
jgi:long-chain acyl-CoA synthetase